jgi:hypothetical protein
MTENASNWKTAHTYESEASAEYADLLSTQVDLLFARSSAELALGLTPVEGNAKGSQVHTDLTNLKALWNAAVIAYSRCFIGGIRTTRLDPAFQKLGAKSQEAKRSHQYFIDLRNKYIAHSVNRFEETQVLVFCTDGVSGGDPRRGFGGLSLMPAYEEPSNVQSFINLCKVMLSEVDEQMETAVSTIEREINSLTPQAIAALPEMGIRLPMTPSEVNRRRR